MIPLPPSHPLNQLIGPFLNNPPAGELLAECLRACRPVFRFFRPDSALGVVGKFLLHPVPASSQDLALEREYHNYLLLQELGLTAAGLVPRLLGRFPELRVGLLVEEIPAPDLDHFLAQAVTAQEMGRCLEALTRLAELLAFFHDRPCAREAVSLGPALGYLKKLLFQLRNLGLLREKEAERGLEAGAHWEQKARGFPDQEVILHGDATPTNFLFPDGRAMAIDLERLRTGDRLFDLSWVTGELYHAWGWRSGTFAPSARAIQHFLTAYARAAKAEAPLLSRLAALDPFYMALALLRIARNSYLSWDYRRILVEEAWRHLGEYRRL